MDAYLLESFTGSYGTVVVFSNDNGITNYTWSFGDPINENTRKHFIGGKLVLKLQNGLYGFNCMITTMLMQLTMMVCEFLSFQRFRN